MKKCQKLISIPLRLLGSQEYVCLSELASMPHLKCLWMTGLSTRRRKILKKQIPHLLINETTNLLSSTIASPRETYSKDQGIWEVPCTKLNYNSVKEKLSEVNKKWTHLEELESS